MNIVQLSGEPRLSPFHIACRLPGDPEFRAYLCDLASVEDVTRESAADYIKIICEIETRNVLKTDAGAGRRLHQFVCKPFAAWRREKETH